MRRVASILFILLPTLPAYAAVTVSPSYLQLTPNQSANFAAAGASVLWQVDNIIGGSQAVGTITTAGVYTAPATPPSPAAVTITAISTTDATDAATVSITLLAHAPTGTTFYVATNGQDTNPGTLAAPFATLQHAAGQAQAGDTILARGGVYTALLTPTHSGTADAGPITFASYPGETAAIDGTGLPIPNGQNGLITLNGVSDVIVQGFEIRNYTSASKAKVPVGVYVTGAGDGVQLIGNHIHDITTTARTTPAKCASNALGVAVYGNKSPTPISALVISGNEIDHLKTGCSETVSVDGNVDGFVVMGNLVHDNDNIGIDAIGFERVSPDPSTDQARNGEIRGNQVFNITSYGNPDYGKQYAADGIYVDGGTKITIEQNIVHNTDYGLELASEHKGHVTSNIIARNNALYANNAAGITIGGYGSGRGGTTDCTIIGNTLFDNDTKNTGSGEIQIQFNASDNIIANNIAYAGSRGLLLNNFTKNASTPAALDYNLYFTPSGSPALFVWNGQKKKGLVAYQGFSGQDANSAFSDPLFISLALPDLDLQSGSPALDTGEVFANDILGATDILGEPRMTNGKVSKGAYER
jgi:parallel beta-helix repeat protein